MFLICNSAIYRVITGNRYQVGVAERRAFDNHQRIGYEITSSNYEFVFQPRDGNFIYAFSLLIWTKVLSHIRQTQELLPPIEKLRQNPSAVWAGHANQDLSRASIRFSAMGKKHVV
jgi:hypothetical protein